MICKSCKEDIPTKFAHSISVNVCPLCGSEIMDAHLQTILNDLKKVMEASKEYEPQINDWLFANFSLKKIDPNEEIQQKQMSLSTNARTGKGVMVNRANDEEADHSDDTTIFAKRAGVNFKKVIDKIKDQNAHIEDDLSLDSDFENQNSINAEEQVDMSNLFEDNSSQALELQKLKRLRAQSLGGGFIKRSE